MKVLKRLDICNYREEFCNDINAIMSSIIADTLESDAIKD